MEINKKNINGIEIKYNNKVDGEKIYKVKNDCKKIDKNYKISRNIKKYVNNNEEIDSEDSNFINNSSEKNAQTEKKNTANFQENSSKQLNELYNKENTKIIKDIFKNIHHEEMEIDNFGDDNNKYKRKEKRVYTVEVRKINENDKNLLNNYDNEENIEQAFKRKDKRLTQRREKGWLAAKILLYLKTILKEEEELNIKKQK
jgi:hypothetical protein